MLQFQVVFPGDPDGDGWDTAAEGRIGTGGLDPCGTTAGRRPSRAATTPLTSATSTASGAA
jgi:hypothetical protein